MAEENFKIYPENILQFNIDRNKILYIDPENRNIISGDGDNVTNKNLITTSCVTLTDYYANIPTEKDIQYFKLGIVDKTNIDINSQDISTNTELLYYTKEIFESWYSGEIYSVNDVARKMAKRYKYLYDKYGDKYIENFIDLKTTVNEDDNTLINENKLENYLKYDFLLRYNDSITDTTHYYFYNYLLIPDVPHYFASISLKYKPGAQVFILPEIINTDDDIIIPIPHISNDILYPSTPRNIVWEIPITVNYANILTYIDISKNLSDMLFLEFSKNSIDKNIIVNIKKTSPVENEIKYTATVLCVTPIKVNNITLSERYVDSYKFSLMSSSSNRVALNKFKTLIKTTDENYNDINNFTILNEDVLVSIVGLNDMVSYTQFNLKTDEIKYNCVKSAGYSCNITLLLKHLDTDLKYTIEHIDTNSVSYNSQKIYYTILGSKSLSNAKIIYPDTISVNPSENGTATSKIDIYLEIISSASSIASSGDVGIEFSYYDQYNTALKSLKISDNIINLGIITKDIQKTYTIEYTESPLKDLKIEYISSGIYDLFNTSPHIFTTVNIDKGASLTYSWYKLNESEKRPILYESTKDTIKEYGTYNLKYYIVVNGDTLYEDEKIGINIIDPTVILKYNSEELSRPFVINLGETTFADILCDTIPVTAQLNITNDNDTPLKARSNSTTVQLKDNFRLEQLYNKLQGEILKDKEITVLTYMSSKINLTFTLNVYSTPWEYEFTDIELQNEPKIISVILYIDNGVIKIRNNEDIPSNLVITLKYIDAELECEYNITTSGITNNENNVISNIMTGYIQYIKSIQLNDKHENVIFIGKDSNIYYNDNDAEEFNKVSIEKYTTSLKSPKDELYYVNENLPELYFYILDNYILYGFNIKYDLYGDDDKKRPYCAQVQI